MQSIVIIIMLILGLIVLVIVQFALIKSKNAMKHANDKLERLFESMQEGFALHEIICNSEGKPIDYKFLSVNKSFEIITGLKAEEIINKTVKQVMPNTEDYWIEKYGEVALQGQTEIFSNYANELDKYFKVSVYSPEKMQFVTIFADITEQVRAKEKIEKEVLLFENILENTMSGYWDKNLVEGTEYFSPSLKKMFGYEVDEPIGRNFWKERIYKEDMANIENSFRNHVKSHGEIPFYTEIRYYHKDGSTVWVICSGKVIEWGENNRPLRIVGCHINITN
ncbi:MAG: PAS domain S-box protein, partial [Lachnospiraceae bacterium]|nr:PAS domain S-box protein [Lachnospiraceae bacterium]